MINWHAVDKKIPQKIILSVTKKLKSNMSLEVTPVTCFKLDPLINLIYFYHLDSLVVVLLLSHQLFMKFCYFKDLLTIDPGCVKKETIIILYNKPHKYEEMKRKIKVISYYFFYHQLNITPSKYCLIKSKKAALQC